MKKYFLWLILIFFLGVGLFFIFKDKLLGNKNTKNRNVSDQILNKIKDNLNKNKATNELQIKEDSLNKTINAGLNLEVFEPKDKATVNSSTIIISGKTNPNAEVFVNEKELKADAAGNFSISYELFEGENNIYVAVNDNVGNFAEKSVTVYLETVE